MLSIRLKIATVGISAYFREMHFALHVDYLQFISVKYNYFTLFILIYIKVLLRLINLKIDNITLASCQAEYHCLYV